MRPRLGAVGSRGCPRHGCRGQAPRDGFTASPHDPTAPAKRGCCFHDPAASHEGLRRWPYPRRRRDNDRMETVRIATRKSPLALWQSEHVANRLRQAHPGLHVELLSLIHI